MRSAAEPFAGRSILVTGASGFVGANLVRDLIARGARVHVLLRPGGDRWRLADVLADLKVHEGDVTEARDVTAAFDVAAPGCVFHLAVPRGAADAWAGLVRTSTLAAIHLVAALQRSPATPLVVTGSSLEYGPSALPHREEDTLKPVTWHGTGKAAAGLVLRQASASMGLRIHQLRLFHVYGPWESSHRLLPSAIRAALTGAPLSLTAADIRRDWIHVEDVVEALRAAAVCDLPASIFNVGSGCETSNEELVDVVEQLTGKCIERRLDAFPASPSDTAHRSAELGKIRADLGWSSRYDLTAGVSATLAWHLRNPQHWEQGFGSRPLHA